MIIETLAWGRLDINEAQIQHFPKGIPGFEEDVDFALIMMEEGPFSYLQSLQNHNVSFLLTDPFTFYPAYEFELPEADKEELGITNDVIIRCMVTIKEELEHSTVNLLAPIVVNPIKRVGKQIVLHNSKYQTRHSLLNVPHDHFKKGGE